MRGPDSNRRKSTENIGGINPGDPIAQVIEVYKKHLKLHFKKTLSYSFDRDDLLDKLMGIRGRSNPIPEIVKIKPGQIKGEVLEKITSVSFEGEIKKLFGEAINEEFKEIRPIIRNELLSGVNYGRKIPLETIKNKILEKRKYETLYYIDELIRGEYDQYFDRIKVTFKASDLDISENLKRQNTDDLNIYLSGEGISDDIVSRIMKSIGIEQEFFPEQYDEIKGELLGVFEGISLSKELQNLNLDMPEEFLSQINQIYHLSPSGRTAVILLISKIEDSILGIKEHSEALRARSDVIYFKNIDFLLSNEASEFDNSPVCELFKYIDSLFNIVAKRLGESTLSRTRLAHQNAEKIGAGNFYEIQDFCQKYREAMGLDTALFNVFEIYTTLKLLIGIMNLNDESFQYVVTIDGLRTIQIKKNGNDYIHLYRNIGDHQSQHLEIDLLYLNFEKKTISLLDSKFTTSNHIVSRAKIFENKFSTYFKELPRILSYISNKTYFKYLSDRIESLGIEIKTLNLDQKNRGIIAAGVIQNLVNETIMKKYFLPIPYKIEMYDFLGSGNLPIQDILQIKIPFLRKFLTSCKQLFS